MGRKKCEKHPNNIYNLNLCNGKYLLCLDCIAEFAVSQGVSDLAGNEEKKKCELNEKNLMESIEKNIQKTQKDKLNNTVQFQKKPNQDDNKPKTDT